MIAANLLSIIILLVIAPCGIWKLWLVQVASVLVVGFAVMLAATNRATCEGAVGQRTSQNSAYTKLGE